MKQIMSIPSHSVEETCKVARLLAPCLYANSVVLLNGDLGAGKTHFTQALAQALGVTQEVTSPTFNLVVSYEGFNLRLHHFDLYRLNEAQELEDIAFYETLEDGGVCVIEWADKFPDEMPESYLNLEILVKPDLSREICVFASDEEACVLAQAWLQALCAAGHKVTAELL